MLTAHLVWAAAPVELPQPGLTPESPFYFLDTWGEKLSLAFTFKAEEKAEKAKNYAEEKPAEVKTMIEEEKTDKINEALSKYQDYLDQAFKKAEEAKEQGKDVEKILATIAEATQKHLTLLAEVYEKVPGQAKEAILNAMEKSRQGQENALQAVSGKKKEQIKEKVKEVKEKYQLKKLPADLPGKLKKSLGK